MSARGSAAEDTRGGVPVPLCMCPADCEGADLSWSRLDRSSCSSDPRGLHCRADVVACKLYAAAHLALRRIASRPTPMSTF